MSREREDEARRWSDEDLLEWVLDEELRERYPREALEGDPEVAARLFELESFLSSCRDSLAERYSLTEAVEAELEPGANEALVESILASTTREDLSWRGDLRLVGGFLRQRLRSSRLLRVVAASLLLHIVALPAIAYYAIFVAPERTTVLRFDPGPGELPYAPEELEPEREVEEPALDDLDAYELFGERLVREGVAPLDRLSETPDGERIWSDPLGLVLWCEALLDELERQEAAPGRERHLDFALSELEQLLESAHERDALRRLAASAWLRAHEAGRASPDPRLLAVCRERLEGGTVLTTEEWARAYREADEE